jgi:hypothetical protein
MWLEPQVQELLHAQRPVSMAFPEATFFRE